MKTVTEHLREDLLQKAGVVKVNATMPSLDELRQTEWSPLFETLMRNRLIMGAFRYERFGPGKSNYPTATEAIRRILNYIETGNTESLVDAANMLLIEFEFGRHPNKHFAGIDDGEHCLKIA